MSALTTAGAMERRIAAKLAAPFPAHQLKFRAGATSGGRALAMVYIDARLVQARLDEVVGVPNWQDDYTLLASGEVACRLAVRFGNEWVAKVDVGGQSEQPDDRDKMKAAYSDALKRAAVKFGVGRYLYDAPQVWVDYDPQKKKLLKVPDLPPHMLPSAKDKLPATGADCIARVFVKDQELAAAGAAKPNDLVGHVLRAVAAAGGPPLVADWTADDIDRAVGAVKAFLGGLPK